MIIEYISLTFIAYLVVRSAEALHLQVLLELKKELYSILK